MMWLYIQLKNLLKRFLPAPLYGAIQAIKNTVYTAHTLIFQVHLTYHCNLKCAYCSHFSSIAEERFMDMSVFERDLRRLSALGGMRVRQIDLLGGEPLLHPRVTDALAITRKAFPRTRIVLFTNGILLSAMQDAFWQECSKSAVIIAISHYPSIKLNIAALDSLACKHAVNLVHHNLNQPVFFGHFRFDMAGTSDGMLNARLCGESKVCHCLDNGKLYLCFIPALIGIFNTRFGTDIPVSSQDYLDIYAVKSFSEIMRFLKSTPPFCSYCNWTKGEVLPWRHPSAQDISEWT
jgi:hypothetical protein